MKTVHLTLNPLEKKSHINREIYGNFSEHLGRCVYDGIYVGKNSDIPNINGYRKDSPRIESHPSWVCGLKQKTDFIF